MPQDEASLIPDEPIPFSEMCSIIHSRITTFLAETPADWNCTDKEKKRLENVQAQTRISLRVIEEALEKYSLDELSLSYNGGKDCLVLLVLYLAALHSKTLKSSNFRPTSLECVFIQSSDPFEEVTKFVEKTSRQYNLNLSRYSAPMKGALTDYLQEKPNVQAIFVGTRRTDPHGTYLTHFDRTDHGWPDFMRIHPVIDWHYVDIWTFICHLKIPYCCLYDQGYTSLGGTRDTHPNPKLLRIKLPETIENGKYTHLPDIWKNTSKYRPAWELMDDEEERLGRDN
ncbi:adenine nucleotide alpha hydrolases-like protein [Patellaria atrata CBS 101060]|uniref:FAD synthase n=1 Tax=Patellaria atrata CBS 101060 TaxID=1346257 RepID=A0A9P4VPM1_9PEZI|nr:adenine nucleotide alpha hydrolases-like protein [Patellaria atrata CBS 101060]